jgi:hypothetical protein
VKHRRHTRVEAKQVTGQVKTNDRAAPCNIENISAGGLFIRTATPMPIGLPVIVDMSGPGIEDGLRASGRVVSVISTAEAAQHGCASGVGIEFDPLPGPTERKLHVLLRELGLRDIAAPAMIPAPELYATASPDPNHVVGNVAGLLDMLAKALATVHAQDRELATLRAEVRRLTSERGRGR